MLKLNLSQIVDFNQSHEEKCFPEQLVQKLIKLGIYNSFIPKEYGGSGKNYVENGELTKACAYEDLSLAIKFRLLQTVTITPILNDGNDELKQLILPKVAKGDVTLSFALTEPEAGSNTEAMKTTIKETSEGLEINGVKTYIGNAGTADYIIVFGKHLNGTEVIGTSAVLVPSNKSGIQVSEEIETLGLKPVIQRSIIFEKVICDTSYLLGMPGKGNKIMQDALQKTRLEFLPLAIGGINRMRDILETFLPKRNLKSGPLSAYIATQNKERQLNIKSLLLRSLEEFLKDDQTHIPFEAPLLAKLAGSEWLMECIDDALQLLGGKGYTYQSDIPRFFRDARVLRIVEGPNETLYSYFGRLSRLKTFSRYLVSRGCEDISQEIEAFERQTFEFISDQYQQHERTIIDEQCYYIVGQYCFYRYFLEILKRQSIDSENYNYSVQFLNKKLEMLKGDVYVK